MRACACAATIRLQPPEDRKPRVIKNGVVYDPANVLPKADNNRTRSSASQSRFVWTVHLRKRITSHEITLSSVELRNPGNLLKRQATAPQHL